MILTWNDIKRLDPRAAQALRDGVERIAKEDANDKIDEDLPWYDIDADDGKPWYDSIVEYGGNPPGLDRMLEQDVRAIREDDGAFLVEINPSGQVYDPGPTYYRCWGEPPSPSSGHWTGESCVVVNEWEEEERTGKSIDDVFNEAEERDSAVTSLLD